MSYSELLSKNQGLKQKLGLPDYKIAFLSNIINNQAKEIFEYHLKSNGINAEIIFGDYDNIVQDSEKYQDINAVLIFWELSNLIDGLQYKANNLSEEDVNNLIIKIKSEITFTLKNLENTPTIIFNKFSSLIFNSKNINYNNFDLICNELNNFLTEVKTPNLFLIDIDKIITALGIDNSVDLRYFYSSKALYSFDFFQSYINFIMPLFLNLKGKIKKAIIFDCDNTLWKGVLGEDGFDNIKMSSKTPDGVVFEEVQELAVNLAKNGIIIGLCSKNNPEEVEEVLKRHPDLKLKNDYIVIKKINWENKTANLKAISKELNIGLDSIVFVDDADFEINLINEQLPEIKTFKVPKKLSQYPKMIRDNLGLFFNNYQTKEDLKRLDDYKKQAQRTENKNEFDNIDDYLKSLAIELTIYQNYKEHIPRIAQLTKKTNQFNLTTQRYTEAEITAFIESNNFDVFSVDVNDKFGESGLTAVIIIEKKNECAVINSFLMSCRIIGRKIELAISDYIINYLKNQNIQTIKASYLKTIKNEQVNNFYKNLGFKILFDSNDKKDYFLQIDKYKPQDITYIGVKNGTKN